MLGLREQFLCNKMDPLFSAIIARLKGDERLKEKVTAAMDFSTIATLLAESGLSVSEEDLSKFTDLLIYELSDEDLDMRACPCNTTNSGATDWPDAQ